MFGLGNHRAEFKVEIRAGAVVKTYTLSVPVSMPVDEIEGLMILVGMVEPRIEQAPRDSVRIAGERGIYEAPD